MRKGAMGKSTYNWCLNNEIQKGLQCSVLVDGEV